jgi:hypothetical protein
MTLGSLAAVLHHDDLPASRASSSCWASSASSGHGAVLPSSQIFIGQYPSSLLSSWPSLKNIHDEALVHYQQIQLSSMGPSTSPPGLKPFMLRLKNSADIEFFLGSRRMGPTSDGTCRCAS